MVSGGVGGGVVEGLSMGIEGGGGEVEGGSGAKPVQNNLEIERI